MFQICSSMPLYHQIEFLCNVFDSSILGSGGIELPTQTDMQYDKWDSKRVKFNSLSKLIGKLSLILLIVAVA